MILRLLRLSFGILLLPVVFGYAVAFYEQLVAIHEVKDPHLALLFGMTSYLGFHLLIMAPTRLYIFGHELMHTIATWISGGKVKGFKVGKKKGSVKTDRVNPVIALAPYVVPVYSILLGLLYGIAGFFWDTSPWTWWFLFVLGLTLTFHLVFTIVVLREEQTDLHVVGPLLSLVLIVWFNMTLVIGAVSLVIPEVHFGSYLMKGFDQTQAVYQEIFYQLFVQ